MAEIFKLFQKADVLVLATPVYFYRYRGTPQGSVHARTLTRCSRKSPSVMAFLACMSRDFGIFMPKHLARDTTF